MRRSGPGMASSIVRSRSSIELVHAEGGPHGLDDLAGGGLVEGDAERVVVDRPQVEARARVPRPRSRRLGPGTRTVIVSKNASCATSRSPRRNPAARIDVSRWTRRGDAAEAVGAVVRRVETGDHGQQHLCGADVARGLLASDVLLAGLQRQPVGGAAVGVDRHTDEAPGQRALVRRRFVAMNAACGPP